MDPVFADLISVSLVYRLDLVAQIVNQTHHGLEVPPFAAHALPYLAIVLEGPERDQCVMGGAATEYFRAGMPDVRVACCLITNAAPERRAQTYHWVVQQYHNHNLGPRQAG